MHDSTFDPDIWRGTIRFPPSTQFGINDAGRVAGRVAEMVFGEGYDWFIRYVTHEGVMDFGVEVLPAEGNHGDRLDTPDKCQSILVGVAKGSKGRRAMKTVMTAVLARIVECLETVTAIVVVTDDWNSPDFERDHLRQVVAHMKRGIAFLFLVVGPDQRTVSQIHIDPVAWRHG